MMYISQDQINVLIDTLKIAYKNSLASSIGTHNNPLCVLRTDLTVCEIPSISNQIKSKMFSAPIEKKIIYKRRLPASCDWYHVIGSLFLISRKTKKYSNKSFICFEPHKMCKCSGWTEPHENCKCLGWTPFNYDCQITGWESIWK